MCVDAFGRHLNATDAHQFAHLRRPITRKVMSAVWARLHARVHARVPHQMYNVDKYVGVCVCQQPTPSSRFVRGIIKAEKSISTVVCSRQCTNPNNDSMRSAEPARANARMFVTRARARWWTNGRVGGTRFARTRVTTTSRMHIIYNALETRRGNHYQHLAD